MRDEDRGGVEAERLGLGVGGFDELGRGYEDGRAAFGLEVGRVMHTARRAGPSIGEGFDDEVALAEDLLQQRPRSRSREGRLAEPLDLRAALVEQLLEPVEEDVAAGLRDVEQRHPAALDRVRAGDPLTVGRLALAGRVEYFQSAHSSYLLTSTVTGVLPPALGLTQLERMPLNIPALPPAWTKYSPPSRN